MKFGIFDHLDRTADVPLADFYDERLALIEEYDRQGFHAYHLAEHHSTSLGMAPSPSVFLSAIAQRTKRLRLGAMVYAMPLHHPLRLVEEICMLDQLSRGRLELGFGRGSSPVELEYFGVDPAKAERMYQEGVQIIRQGLTQREVDFHGEFYQADHVPMELQTMQKPMPPVWYGVHSTQSAEKSAEKGFNVLGLAGPESMAEVLAHFRSTWDRCRPDDEYPLMGIGRFVVVADSRHKAMAIASRAYAKWHHSFTWLARTNQRAQRVPRPDTFEAAMAAGQAVAGTPDDVIAALDRQVRMTGANYVVGQLAFGDLSMAEASESVGLFCRHVMPALRSADAVHEAA